MLGSTLKVTVVKVHDLMEGRLTRITFIEHFIQYIVVVFNGGDRKNRHSIILRIYRILICILLDLVIF